MALTAEDRIAIADLHARNAWALDLGDAPAFVATFTADAVLRMKQPYEGRHGIEQFMAEFRERDFGFPRAQHLVTQLLIDDAGGDRAGSRSYVTRVHRLPGQHRGNCHVMWTGYSIDTCVRVDGRWLFETRTLCAWEGDVADAIGEAEFEPAGRRG
jgi:hypothetical protein